MVKTFFLSEIEQPHRWRAHAILKAHPDIRRLIGPNPWTAVLITGLVCFQLSIAWLMGNLGAGYWWLSLIFSYSIGAFANHALYVGIHDAAHDLIFHRRSANKIIAIFADLPNVIPGALGFRNFHLRHHSHQGQHALDLDIPNHFEAGVVDNRWYCKAVWLLLFPFVAMARSFRIGRYFDHWLRANFLAVLAFDAFVFVYFGANGLLYLVLSFLFALGLHPVGARLPQLRALAPEFYHGLEYHRSWTKLLVRFIFDPRYSLYGRIVR